MRWTAEAAAARLREAWDTLRRAPAHTVPGFTSSWPQVVRDAAEAYGYGGAAVRLARASPAQIDRMHETFGWFAALEDRPDLTKAVWLTAACGMGPRRAGAILGVHRDTVRRRRDQALALIVRRLNRL